MVVEEVVDVVYEGEGKKGVDRWKREMMRRCCEGGWWGKVGDDK